MDDALGSRPSARIVTVTAIMTSATLYILIDVLSHGPTHGQVQGLYDALALLGSGSKVDQLMVIATVGGKYVQEA